MESFKRFFHHPGNCKFLICITLRTTTTPNWIHPLNIRKWEQCNTFRSSHRRCSVKKGVLRNTAKFTGKQLCQSLFLHKIAGFRPVTLFKKRLWHRCFPVNFMKFLKAPFLQNTSRRLLLQFQDFSHKKLTLIHFSTLKIYLARYLATIFQWK